MSQERPPSVDTQVTLALEEAIPVLDHGFVRLIAYSGGDESIERAARQSYGKGTRRVNKTRGLIRRLIFDRHDTPTEAVDITIQFQVPIFVARQILRHRLFSVNEYSGRYSEMLELFYVPELDQICYQDKKNKQGRAEAFPLVDAQRIRAAIAETSEMCFDTYHHMLLEGVARETARIVLPLNTYTTFTLKGNLRTWLHFLALRMDWHAQWETRTFANVVSEIVRQIAPDAYDAFEEYVLNAGVLSRTMRRILVKHLHDDAVLFAQMTSDEDFDRMTSHEQARFIDILSADV